MIKLIPPDAYSWDQPRTQLVKIASFGLGWNDRRDLMKVASEGFVEKIARLDLKPGDEPAINLALSTTEAVGPNRNGDGFTNYWCERNYPTFVKHARPYRNHRNNPDSPYYGVVKLSHFNPEMQRIELGIIYNGTKEAAARNGGLVADLEMEKLAAGKAFDSSMACSLDPFALVRTTEGDKPIYMIQVGDQVLTHLNRWRRVTELRRRKYTGRACCISPCNGRPLELTEDHLLWCVRELTSDLNPKFEWLHCKHLDIQGALSEIPSAGYSFVLQPIRSVHFKDVVDVDVYNLEVEEDHSYHLNGFASHNCFVKHDVCSSCGNKAKTRANYCHGSMCKHGGLRDNIGRVFADGHHLHADNPDPHWFDISHIVGGRGADRTSFTLGSVKKAAVKIACGAELADDLDLVTPYFPDLFGLAARNHAKIAADLSGGESDPELRRALGPLVEDDLLLPPDGTEKLAVALKALADAGVVLPPRSFLALATGDPKLAEAAAPAVAAAVPRAYSDLLAGGDEAFASNPFLPADHADKSHRKWASEVAKAFAMDPDSVRRRSALADVREARGIKIARVDRGFSPTAAAVARSYVLYKIAALAAVPAESRASAIRAARAQDASRV